jgi:hypothetical protein
LTIKQRSSRLRAYRRVRESVSDASRERRQLGRFKPHLFIRQLALVLFGSCSSLIPAPWVEDYSSSSSRLDLLNGTGLLKSWHGLGAEVSRVDDGRFSALPASQRLAFRGQLPEALNMAASADISLATDADFSMAVDVVGLALDEEARFTSSRCRSCTAMDHAARA